MESNLSLSLSLSCICKLNARFPSALPGRARAAARGTKEGERERVDYRDEEEVDDGVVTAGGSCKIKRRLLLC